MHVMTSQRVNRSEIYRFLKSIIVKDKDITLKLREKPCIYDMCSDVIQHDEIYLDQHIDRFVDILRIAEIRHHASPMKNLRILDVGAGVGFLSILLKVKYGHCVEAVDLKESVIFWEERFRKYGIPLKSCDITIDPLPYPAENFDFVIFSEVLEHLVTSPIYALKQIRRVLKYKGYLILTTPNMCRLANIGKLILGKNIVPDFRKYELCHHPKTPHFREYTLNEVLLLIDEVKLKAEKVYMSRCWDHFRSKRFFGVITYLLPRYRSCIMIKAKKL